MGIETFTQPLVQYHGSMECKDASQDVLTENMVGGSANTASSTKQILVGPIAPCHIHDYTTYRAKINPSAPAIQQYDGQEITHAELVTMAKKIAQGLQIQPKTIVPICMDTSPEFVATIIAVLMSGAAHVTLDPAGALERNNGIVEDCHASVVVVDQVYAPLFTKSVILQDAANSTSSLDPNNIAESAITNPAYLIYTSGSTGKPKGVVLTHEAATYGMSNFSLRGHARWLLLYDPIFSAAQRTILATLAKGACLCLAPREKLATDLVEVLRKLKIDALGITPSGLALLSSEAIQAA